MNESEEIFDPLSSPAKGGKGGAVLVTGASGFLGRHLVKKLSDEGFIIRALYNQHEPPAELKSWKGVNWQRCDLLDVFEVEEALQGISEVYHCAAMVSFQPSDKEKMMHFNIESTANIVNQALEQGIRKMVYVSSIASLGRGTKNEITEEEQWEESRYNSQYARSKHLAELEVWRAMGEGLNAVIINPGIILGAPVCYGAEIQTAWKKGTAALMHIANKEFPFYTAGINAFADAADVVSVMIQLMKSDIADERFILSAGNFSYKELFSLMAKALSKKPPHIKAGSFLSGVVWRFNRIKAWLSGKEPTLTKETALNAQKKNFYAATKISRFLPEYHFKPITETITNMATSFHRDMMKRG